METMEILKKANELPKIKNELNELSKAMFNESLPCNPIPFLNGLITGVKTFGTNWITLPEAKKILFTILLQSYGQCFILESWNEYQRLSKLS